MIKVKSKSEGKFNICFSGHRPEKLGGYNWANKTNIRVAYALIEVIKALEKTPSFKEHFNSFLFGGAIGFDQLAYAVVDKNFPQYTKTLCLPFKKQHMKWGEEDQRRYIYQKSVANEVIYTDEFYSLDDIGEYSPMKMQKRNEFMIDHSAFLIACWDGSKSGTYNCKSYADKLNIKIIIINPKDC